VKSHFQLMLGDNFYYDGVTDVNDPRFKATFEEVYTAPQLMTTTWHVQVGNHDHNGDVQAQIDYSAKSQRWSYPSRFYTLSYKLKKTNTAINFISIDTVTLAGQVKGDHDFAQPSGPVNAKLAEDSWAWIEEQLQRLAPTSDYLFVYGHYPVYSVSSHGPTKVLLQKLEPMLRKYKVNALLCGHDHNNQHINVSYDGGKIDYVVAGVSSRYDTSQSHKSSVPANSLRYFFPTSSTKHGGFVYTEIDESKATFHYFTSDAKFPVETYKFYSYARTVSK